MTVSIDDQPDHRWDAVTIEECGNARCSQCGMQFTYYTDGMATLRTWTKKDIEQDKEHYANVLKRFQVCDPR